jgi:hypothetical protein
VGGSRHITSPHVRRNISRRSPRPDPVVLLTVRLDERPPGLPGLCLPSRRTVAANTCVDEQV